MAEILIVEDSYENSQLLSNIFQREGYNIQIARNGADALEFVSKNLPDLILLDINMPKMDGYETCIRLKSDPATDNIPVIFISAMSELNNIVKAFEVGGIDYITKPFRTQEIIARVRNHVQLIEHQKQLVRYFESVNRMKEQFIQAATHDLKSPLQLVLGYIGLLEDMGGEEFERDGKMYINGVRDGAARMQTLITNMLDLTQLETGVGLDLKACHLNILLKRTVSNFLMHAMQADIELELGLLADDNDLITVDEHGIGRVLDNLVSNAIKYSPKGGCVNVIAEATPETIIIKVVDTGYGIPERNRDNIFTPFYRVKASEYIEVEGTGLGLSIVKAIIEQHKGTIQVESELGEGTTFTVTLPRV